jgi:ribonucleoside-diphosphate reductase alpha chain
MSDVVDWFDLAYRCEAAAAMGTYQATLTDFRYLRPEWTENAEQERLIGVSLTGVDEAVDKEWFSDQTLTDMSYIVRDTNERVADALGIHTARARTCLKPSGSSSMSIGCTNGCKNAPFIYGVRRVQIAETDPMVPELLRVFGPSFMEKSVYSPGWCITVPIQYSDGHPELSVIEMLRRVKFLYENWIHPGILEGDAHAVSVTVSYRSMWDFLKITVYTLCNLRYIPRLTVFPESGHAYKQLPFEAVSRERFETLQSLFVASVKNFDWSNIQWNVEDLDKKTDVEVSCSGGACEIRSL